MASLSLHGEPRGLWPVCVALWVAGAFQRTPGCWVGFSGVWHREKGPSLLWVLIFQLRNWIKR